MGNQVRELWAQLSLASKLPMAWDDAQRGEFMLFKSISYKVYKHYNSI
jgi:hypothetical protein